LGRWFDHCSCRRCHWRRVSHHAPDEEEGVISSEPATNFDDAKATAPAAEELPWKKPANPFTLETQGKKVESKADKFDSLFNDDDNDLPF
jgi:hypothetical protein